jgi:DNA-binding MarR family transcriptional regulator
MHKALTLNRLQQRDAQCEDLPDFRSKEWPILLEIFTTEMSGQVAYVTTIALGSSVAVSSTHRHLDALHQRDLIIRQRDASDRRRIRVQLTDKARQQLTHYLDHI